MDKQIKLSSKAIAQRRRGMPYTIPIKRPRLSANDEKYVMRNRKMRRTNTSDKRYSDIDYSYERMELRDRLLDMNPAPPPYADVSERPDLDSNPSVPPPNITDDAYKDENKPIDDHPEDPEDPEDNNDDGQPKEMTKQDFEDLYLQTDGPHNTYDTSGLYLGASLTSYAPLETLTYEWLKQYMQFNRPSWTDWASSADRNTPFKVTTVESDWRGIKTLDFAYYQTDKYFPDYKWQIVLSIPIK